MYKVYADNILICSSKAEETAIINPVISLEGNNAGTFTFTMPPKHPFYAQIKRRKSIIDVYRGNDTEPLFEGVCVSDDTDFYKQKKIVCEGELTFFNDSFLRPAHRQGLSSRQLLQEYVNEHNSKVEAAKRFTVGQVTAHDSNDYITCYTNYQSTMKEIKEDLIDDIGGYLRTRHENGVRYLDYLADAPRTNNQVIRLGENLIDLTKNFNTDDLATVIIPLGAKLDESSIEGLEERLTIKSTPADEQHPNGTDYVYSVEAVENFGWIEKTVEWDNVTTTDALLRKGKEYLSQTQFENMVITVKAFDLGLTSDEFQTFRLLDKIRVISEPHGLDKYFVLTKMTINLNNPEQDTITLGSEQKTSLSAKTVSANTEILKRIEKAPNSQAIASAIENATALLTGAEGGYVYVVRNSDGQPTEIRVQDALNNPTKIWRWNRNGFGYSNDGGQTYGLAMTMDGAIVADFITAGTLLGDRIKGGTYEVGGAGLAKDGKILVKNAQGQTLITIDKNGITFSGGEKIAYSDISGAPNSVLWEHDIYIKCTTDTFPAQPSGEVTTWANNLEDTWSLAKPNSLTNMARCWKSTQRKLVDGTIVNGSVSEYVTKMFSTKITKDTVTAAYINALNVTAKYINSEELRNTGVAKVAGWGITEDSIVSYDNTNYQNSLKYCVIHKYTGDNNAAAVGIFSRPNTNSNYVCQVAFRWDGALISSSALNIYTNNAQYGLWVHGKEYVEGDINNTGGIYTNYNMYADGNVSGSVTDGRAGLNCTGGGLYVYGNIYANGSIGCGGSKPRVVHTKTYGYRQMNAYETPTPYFGDIGEGKLNEEGECLIFIDDIFSETVNLDVKYQVFLQKYGQGDVWVGKREANYFVVKGTPNLAFGWEVKAVQLNYEYMRLDTPDDTLLATILEQKAQEGI